MSIILTVVRRPENVRAENAIGNANVWEDNGLIRERVRQDIREEILNVELTNDQWNAVKRAVLNTI